LISGSRLWAGLATFLCVLALAAQALPHEAIDWQPALAADEPWRAFSAAAVHYSSLHLVANLVGAALVAALGLAAQGPPRLALAWFVAWPLTQVLLLARPELAHFGGLSGVLHAGVAVIAVHLMLRASGRRRWIAAALFVGLVAKVAGEAPWGDVLRHPPEWDIAVAPLAHATGLLAGAACALLGEAGAQWKTTRHV
jgi:rhomboid family GlyGly-CTERM serine protease